MPTTMLSGYTFPIDQMPAAVRAVTHVVYARYYVTLLRAIFLKGSPLLELWPSLAALAAFALVVGWLAARAFRKRLD